MIRSTALLSLFKSMAGLVVFVSSVAFAADSTLHSKPRELVLLNWSEYLDPDLVEKFEQQFKVKLREVYFESDDGRDHMMLETDGKGYDLALVNGIMVDVYRKRGWLSPVSKAQIPNLNHIDSRWLDAFPGLEGYAVPYFWGTMGIAYRKDLVQAPLSSWMDILQPAEYLHGRIGMVENSRDALGMALKALGYSANSTDAKQIKAAEQLLLAQKPHVKTYTYVALNEESALVNGDIIAAMLYSGDALMLQEHHQEIDYVVPSEGGNIWVDYLVVLENPKNKELAWAFLNFLNEPENAAQLAEFVYYATPNKGAEKLLPAEFLEDPVIYPSQAVLSRSEFYKPLPPSAVKRRNIAFSRALQ
ncbi:MAG: spermidine/putrescine ABC transporter substrate-binding protein [Pseudomonadota bacterium]|nr:spermidine/putrescine ABC transporter substrate-binding protein [Pseudomonadota bacterium]